MGRIMALSLVLLFPMTAFAQEPAPKTAEQKLAILNKEFSKANSDFRAELAKLKDRRERSLFMRQKNPSAQFAPKFLALAEESPKDPAAFKALLWVLRSRSYGMKQKALKQLGAHHAGNKDIKQTFWSVSRIRGGSDFFRKVIKEHKDTDTIGAATYLLGTSLSRSQSKDELKEAEALLKSVKEKYADVMFGRGKLGAQVDSALFKLTKLGIGCVAPDIEGEDGDGVKFKLSDYRGKVVVLDFWGDW